VKPRGRRYQDRFTEPISPINPIPHPWSKRNDTRNDVRLSENCFDTRPRRRHPDNTERDSVYGRLRFHPPAPRLHQPHHATTPHQRQYARSRVRHGRSDGVVRACIGSHSASIGGDAPNEFESAEDLGRTHTRLLDHELLRPGRLHRRGDSGDTGGHIDSKVETADPVRSASREPHRSGALE